MSRGRQLCLVLAAVLVLCSALSHVLIWLLGIRTDVIDRASILPEAAGPPVIVAGSSLTFFGVSWQQAAKAMQRPVVTRSVGGASPCELEPLLREVPQARRLIIGVSIFDLNESNLSDSRPALVPFVQSVRDLHASRTDWTATKRILWSYPLPWVQRGFPVAGRSNAVMVGAREKVRSLLKRQPKPEPEARLSFKTDEDAIRPEKLSDWDAGRVARNLSQLASAGLDRGGFDGPKARALARILVQAANQEPTVVLVFPVSPPYRGKFGDAASVAAFEQALARLKAADPNARIIRLDRVPALQSAEVFWDLVHLNDDGHRLATRLVIDELARAPR